MPLARDLAAPAARARLKPRPTSRVVELDLRTPNGLRRSHLLHRLAALGVPWGALEEGRGTSGTFRETWRLRVGARAVGAPRRARRPRHDRRGGGDAPARRAGDGARRASPTLAAALDLALLADLPDAVGADRRACSASGRRTTPTSAS